MKNITQLKEFYKNLGIEVCPYSKEEVAAARQKCGNLPAVLESFYLQIGNLEENIEEVVGDFFFEVASLSWLHETRKGRDDDANEEYILVVSDIHGTSEYVIRKQDMAEENPKLYFLSDGYWEEMQKQNRMYIPCESVAELKEEASDLLTFFNTIADMLEVRIKNEIDY